MTSCEVSFPYAFKSISNMHSIYHLETVSYNACLSDFGPFDLKNNRYYLLEKFHFKNSNSIWDNSSRNQSIIDRWTDRSKISLSLKWETIRTSTHSIWITFCTPRIAQKIVSLQVCVPEIGHQLTHAQNLQQKQFQNSCDFDLHQKKTQKAKGINSDLYARNQWNPIYTKYNQLNV